MANLRVPLMDSKNGSMIMLELVKSSLGDDVNEKQILDPILMQIKDYMGQ